MSRKRMFKPSKRICFLCWLWMVVFLATTTAAETPLRVRDPNASFLNVTARRTALQQVQTPRVREALASTKTCTGAPLPEPPPQNQDIPSRYKSGSHGALNPDERTLSEPYYRVEDVAAWGANQYLATGDTKEAACVINVLLPWAKSKAMLQYNAQDDMVVWFQATWTVASLSLAVSVIRGEPTLNPLDRDCVISWLRDAPRKAVSESRGPRSATSTNNHFFWRGLAAAAAGVVSHDDALFDDGLKTYATAIGEIGPDGAFPQEMSRHELALHYQAFAIEPLVMIAELARRQGIDLYAMEQHGRRLSDAVNFLAGAMADPSLVKKYALEPQQTDPDLQPGSQLLAWVEFWNARNSTPEWQLALAKPFFAPRLRGSTTLYAAPVSEPVYVKPKAVSP